ncbi:hypothetical protein GXW83_04690 [Streptacidiphilus sp. PB12-B1b]|uniref:methyltransferase n=1 Tax=Streptacidiphilus sp. PB12-B1b TaxID=2705012 RepID=UPI0015F9AB80|nr:methyltransferase [Streptacidiphilus sp. PB12-B1b]QMU75162.1 hypothetical protein GXW83_04690 [Streptacidiphilus sp. PB12-B1b]
MTVHDTRTPDLGADQSDAADPAPAPAPAIDPASDPALDERAPSIADRAALFGVLTGGWTAQCLYALAKLGVPDLLAAGPRPVEDLAAECGADRRALRRVLNAVTAAGLFRETAPGTFALTPVTRLLCRDATRSSRPSAIMFGEEVYQSFGAIMHTLRTGEPAFEQLYGKGFYDYLDDDPQLTAVFSAAMGNAAVPAALAGCDLSGLGTVVDVGGGDGGLLGKVLTRHPAARGILVDLPEAVEQARAKLTAAGLDQRVTVAPGSFFDPLPTGGDVYTLSRVLHNWDDEQAVAILRRVREAVPDHGRLLVFERLEGRTPDPARAAQAQLIDVLMLVMLDGRDRTEEEYRGLLDAAGFEVRSVRAAPLHSSSTESVLEATPR